MILSRDQAALVRQGKITGALVPVSQQVKADRTRPLRRRYERHDQDGNPTGVVVETVAETTPDGDQWPVVLTILDVQDKFVEALSLEDARACGHKTPDALRAVWRAAHPKSPMVKVVRFALGDTRDRNRYVAWTGRGGGDYTASPGRANDGDAPALSTEQLVPLIREAREREIERRKHPDQQLRDRLTREIERWEERTGGVTDRDRAQTIRGIRRQLAVLDRKLKAA